MPHRLPSLVVALGVACLAVPAAASAAERTETFRSGPIEVGGYQVKQNEISGAIKHPDVDGFITKMEVDVVDADGRQVPISRLMLHHIVFLNMGRTLGEKRDGTCSSFVGLDSRTVLPGVAERFYAAGEERAKLVLPPGHGYRISKGDQWLMTWMLMNHRMTADRAYIQWKVTYDTDPDIKPVTPYWLDVANCKADPIYDVPGGGRPGSRHVRTSTWTVPRNGRLVATGGHVHGGAYGLRLSQPTCGDRTLTTSDPAWGRASHPFYNVKPVLHEPGPIAMSGTLTEKGYPLTEGSQVKLSSIYDAQYPHTRVMGIALAYVAHDDSVTDPCAPLPDDVQTSTTDEPHRLKPPRFKVPIIGLDSRGRAVEIKRAPGRTYRVGRRATVPVRGFRFTKPNLVMRRGGTVRWRFEDRDLHDVTVADGPRGFSGPHLNGRRTFARKLGTRGTYKLFCSLHPVQMTQTVKVR